MNFKHSAIANLLVLPGPIILGFLGGIITLAINKQMVFMKQYGILLPYDAFVITILGFFLFAVPKIIYIKRGNSITFGSTHMRKRHRIYYRLGYFLMILGIALTVPSIWELLTK